MKTKLVKVSPNCWTVRYNGRDIGTIWRDPVPDGEWNAEGDHSSWACETKQQAIDLLVSERDTDKDKIYSLQKKVKKLQTLLKKANARDR